jgi:hypothetical protein
VIPCPKTAFPFKINFSQVRIICKWLKLPDVIPAQNGMENNNFAYFLVAYIKEKTKQ